MFPVCCYVSFFSALLSRDVRVYLKINISETKLKQCVNKLCVCWDKNRSEYEIGRRGINGVKYSDVDYINRSLKMQWQLGKKINTKKEDFAPKTYTKQEVGLETQSSTECSRFRIMCLKPFWSKERVVIKNVAGEEHSFRLWMISAVRTMEDQEVKIFIGSITSRFKKKTIFRIFADMIFTVHFVPFIKKWL